MIQLIEPTFQIGKEEVQYRGYILFANQTAKKVSIDYSVRKIRCSLSGRYIFDNGSEIRNFVFHIPFDEADQIFI